MAISKAYDELSEKFVILGDTSESPDVYNWQNFVSGINYTAFLIERKGL